MTTNELTEHRYVVRQIDARFAVVDTATHAIVDNGMSKADADTMALALNRVEVTANAYVAQILRVLEGGTP